MYVCVCKGVTDRQIRQAVDDGAGTLRAVRMQLGVASQCGCCARCAQSVIEEHKAADENAEINLGGAPTMAFAAPKSHL
ncbi:MAG: bacterioferritin-associated ferredoxin [Pseudomonadota bacterium]